MFFGREGVFEWIENNLSGKYINHILVLHGQRRVGKTSVLKHIPNRLPDRHIPIFIDLQGRVSTTLGRFLYWLALEAIARVRPGGGFLADDHTLDNWRWGQWMPKMIDRKRYDSWVADGSKDMFTRANIRAREILVEHKVPQLPDEAEKIIAAVLTERSKNG